MARHSDDPVEHVISFRVNHEEKQLLQKLANEYRCSISDFLRRNLQELATDKESMSQFS